MELNIPPVFSRWKSFGICLLLTLALPAALLRGAEPTDAEGLRQQAVSQYIDAATKELAAFGQKIADVARPDNRQLCTEARAKLDECTELLTALKTADSEHFDTIKADYERTRAELMRALQDAGSK